MCFDPEAPGAGGPAAGSTFADDALTGGSKSAMTEFERGTDILDGWTGRGSGAGFTPGGNNSQAGHDKAAGPPATGGAPGTSGGGLPSLPGFEPSPEPTYTERDEYDRQDPGGYDARMDSREGGPPDSGYDTALGVDLGYDPGYGIDLGYGMSATGDTGGGAPGGRANVGGWDKGNEQGNTASSTGGGGMAATGSTSQSGDNASSAGGHGSSASGGGDGGGGNGGGGANGVGNGADAGSGTAGAGQSGEGGQWRDGTPNTGDDGDDVPDEPVEGTVHENEAVLQDNVRAAVGEDWLAELIALGNEIQDKAKLKKAVAKHMASWGAA